VTETVFSWPGLGRFTVNSIYARDFPVIQTVVLFMALAVLAVNLVVDIIYAFLDPRIHYE
jgi:peptide/nickel transport system permease protein